MRESSGSIGAGTGCSGASQWQGGGGKGDGGVAEGSAKPGAGDQAMVPFLPHAYIQIQQAAVRGHW